jgi:hypothetical protein
VLPSRWRAGTGSPGTQPPTFMASRLPLRRYRDIRTFLHHTRDVRRQLGDATGLIGYSLRAQFARRTFWTLSSWESASSLEQFARSRPHREVVAELVGATNDPVFVRWEGTASLAVPSWAEARAHVAEASQRPASPQATTHEEQRHGQPRSSLRDRRS